MSWDTEEEEVRQIQVGPESSLEKSTPGIILKETAAI